MKYHLLIILSLFLGCAEYQTKRIGDKRSDKEALLITDRWVMRDTENAVTDVIKQMKSHQGYTRYLAQKSGRVAVFIAEIQNLTPESYFPITDFNEELLTEISKLGDFSLVDERARKRILEEVTYQNDGAVDPASAKRIGKQTGADIIIFGNINMRPETRDGKTLKQYSVNIRLTDIESALEIVRTRTKTHKFSETRSLGW